MGLTRFLFRQKGPGNIFTRPFATKCYKQKAAELRWSIPRP